MQQALHFSQGYTERTCVSKKSKQIKQKEHLKLSWVLKNKQTNNVNDKTVDKFKSRAGKKQNKT